MGHIGCDYALQVLQQLAITPRDPNARMEESVFWGQSDLKSPGFWHNCWLSIVGSQWGEGPSVLKQFFPLWHVCIVLKDNLLLMYHAVDWGLFCTLSSAFHGPEMSAASVNFGRNSVLSQRASEIMMSGITLLPHPYHIRNFLCLRFCLFVLKTELPLAALTELALTL